MYTVYTPHMYELYIRHDGFHESHAATVRVVQPAFPSLHQNTSKITFKNLIHVLIKWARLFLNTAPPIYIYIIVTVTEQMF